MPEEKTHRGHTAPDLWEKIKPLARKMRHWPTRAERRLWHALRDRHVRGIKFRRQYSIERFIVDFCAVEALLVIEVDGPTHDYTAEQDAIRQEFIESLGFRVARFTNEDVQNNLEGVVEMISGLV